MAVTVLTFLLIGKTGHGKSKTGNSLLDCYAFRTSASTTSETKRIKASDAEFDNFRLTVVDGPGLEDTDMAKVTDKVTAIAYMSYALGLCNGGVDAFLFVTKFGIRFTQEETSALGALKRIFGTDYMKHVIVVVTCGDYFLYEIENDEENITFDEWCRKQQGAFRQLYDDCEGRVVLVNNFERDESRKHAQRHKILQLAEDLKRRNGQYTFQSFQAAKAERDRMIVEHKTPELGQKIQVMASLLAADINHLLENPFNNERDEQIFRRIQDLRSYIIEQDMGTSVMSNWLELVAKLEDSFHDAKEYQRLAAELKNSRQSRKRTSSLGAFLKGFFS